MTLVSLRAQLAAAKRRRAPGQEMAPAPRVAAIRRRTCGCITFLGSEEEARRRAEATPGVVRVVLLEAADARVTSRPGHECP